MSKVDSLSWKHCSRLSSYMYRVCCCCCCCCFFGGGVLYKSAFGLSFVGRSYLFGVSFTVYDLYLAGVLFGILLS